MHETLSWQKNTVHELSQLIQSQYTQLSVNDMVQDEEDDDGSSKDKSKEKKGNLEVK